MPRFVFYDRTGVPRVYAEHPNIDVAETWAIDEAFKYLRKRPDTGPFATWQMYRGKDLAIKEHGNSNDT